MDEDSDLASSSPPTKKAKLSTDEASTSITNTSENGVLKALEDIEGCQKEIEELNSKAYEEILQIELKYIKLCQSHYEKRNTLIAGVENFWVTAVSFYMLQFRVLNV